MAKESLNKESINFTQIKNEVLQDKNLSWKAKGIYCLIYSKPQGWEFSVERLSNESNDGFDSTNSAVKELESNGYLIRKKLSDGRKEWTIFYTQQTEKPTREKPKLGKSQLGKNGTISNIDLISNKDILAKKDFSPIDEELKLEPNRKGEAMELKAKLARIDPTVNFASDYQPDYDKPKSNKCLTGWQKVYSDLVGWYEKEYNAEVLGRQKQYKALRLIREKHSDLDYAGFEGLVKEKIQTLAGEDWHGGRFDFTVLISQWHKLDKQKKKEELYKDASEVYKY